MATTLALTRSNTGNSSLTHNNQSNSTSNTSLTQRNGSSSPANLVSTVLPKLNVTPQKSPQSPGSAKSTPAQASPAVSEPGRWQHPRMDEVLRRQNKSRFDRDNLKTVTLNAFALIPATLLPMITNSYIYTFPRLATLTSWSSWTPWATIISFIWLARALIILNIGIAVMPLFRTPDACEDIPLDPVQRQLLGLPPLSRPATPQEKEQYVTPPRYSRSNTPRSSSSSLVAHPSDSPLNGRGTPIEGSIRLSGSQFGSQSPLGAPSIRGDTRRRLSYNTPPLSISEFEAAGSTGTPTKNPRASIGLNNKWLYEKGRASPRLSGNW